MRVKLTLAARYDLVEIAKWVAKDSPNQALRLVDDLQLACSALGEFPEAFPILLVKENIKIRRKVHGNYLVFYHVNGKQVEVLYVVHAARLWQPLFD